jgi:histone deacetylase 11
MNKTYLLQLCYGFNVSRLLQFPFFWLPGWVYRWRVLDPMLRATEGTILACCLALQLGWAINLSGGFHHASYDQGGGFCIFPDISLAVHYLQTRLHLQRIMIIDLDAHQGNGYQKDLLLHENVYIVDCYNSRIYPCDTEVKDAISRDIQIDQNTTDQEYLRLVDSIGQDLDYFKPELVIYNAGTDVLAEDPLGVLSLSR